MFRRDFIKGLIAAASGLSLVRPSNVSAAVMPSVVMGAAVGGSPADDLRRMLRQCRCISIECTASVGDIMTFTTVHRSGDDPRGVSLNAEFERMLGKAHPRSVNCQTEVDTIDVAMLSGGPMETFSVDRPVSLIEVEWIGGGL